MHLADEERDAVCSTAVNAHSCGNRKVAAKERDRHWTQNLAFPGRTRTFFFEATCDRGQRSLPHLQNQDLH